MEHSPFWEANAHSATQEIPHLLPWSQGPITGRYPEADESSPHPPTLFP
jgi:hypothetical protein